MEQFNKRLEENNMTLVTSARFSSSKSFPSIISSFKVGDLFNSLWLLGLE